MKLSQDKNFPKTALKSARAPDHPSISDERRIRMATNAARFNHNIGFPDTNRGYSTFPGPSKEPFSHSLYDDGYRPNMYGDDPWGVPDQPNQVYTNTNPHPNRDGGSGPGDARLGQSNSSLQLDDLVSQIVDDPDINLNSLSLDGSQGFNFSHNAPPGQTPDIWGFQARAPAQTRSNERQSASSFRLSDSTYTDRSTPEDQFWFPDSDSPANVTDRQFDPPGERGGGRKLLGRGDLSRTGPPGAYDVRRSQAGSVGDVFRDYSPTPNRPRHPSGQSALQDDRWAEGANIGWTGRPQHLPLAHAASRRWSESPESPYDRSFERGVERGVERSADSWSSEGRHGDMNQPISVITSPSTYPSTLTEYEHQMLQAVRHGGIPGGPGLRSGHGVTFSGSPTSQYSTSPSTGVRPYTTSPVVGSPVGHVGSPVSRSHASPVQIPHHYGNAGRVGTISQLHRQTLEHSVHTGGGAGSIPSLPGSLPGSLGSQGSYGSIEQQIGGGGGIPIARYSMPPEQYYADQSHYVRPASPHQVAALHQQGRLGPQYVPALLYGQRGEVYYEMIPISPQLLQSRAPASPHQYPSHRQAPVRRTGAANDLHVNLELAYEQFKQLEKERKKTEGEMARQNPGRRISSDNAIGIPGLTSNPSRVDRLVSDSFTEHARVVTLIAKMEMLLNTLEKPASPGSPKLSETSPSKSSTGAASPQSPPTTGDGNVKTLHSDIHTTLNCWLDSIKKVQHRRKEEIINATDRHRSGQPRSHDDKDVVALASAIGELASTCRRARTSLWCGLQVVWRPGFIPLGVMSKRAEIAARQEIAAKEQIGYSPSPASSSHFSPSPRSDRTSISSPVQSASAQTVPEETTRPPSRDDLEKMFYGRMWPFVKEKRGVADGNNNAK